MGVLDRENVRQGIPLPLWNWGLVRDLHCDETNFLALCLQFIEAPWAWCCVKEIRLQFACG